MVKPTETAGKVEEEEEEEWLSPQTQPGKAEEETNTPPDMSCCQCPGGDQQGRTRGQNQPEGKDKTEVGSPQILKASIEDSIRQANRRQHRQTRDKLSTTASPKQATPSKQNKQTTTTTTTKYFFLKLTKEIKHSAYPQNDQSISAKRIGHYRLVGLVVKASASRAEDPGFESRLRWDFSGSSHTSDFKIATPVATCQAPGVIGSVLGLVGPVSYDRLRWKV